MTSHYVPSNINLSYIFTQGVYIVPPSLSSYYTNYSIILLYTDIFRRADFYVEHFLNISQMTNHLEYIKFHFFVSTFFFPYPSRVLTYTWLRNAYHPREESIHFVGWYHSYTYTYI